MRHLTLEALARLVDETPDSAEARHLTNCDRCREELEALEQQTDTLGTLPKLMPGPDAWPALRDRLRAEGLVRSGGSGRARSRLVPPLARLAAGLALFIAGGATGYAVRSPAAVPAERPVADVASAVDQVAAPEGAGTSEASASEVTEEVERTEELFAAALDRFMRVNGTEAPDPAMRLATLDNIVLTTAEALNESPADQVINSYHLTAVAQRDELLRQLAVSTDEPVF